MSLILRIEDSELEAFLLEEGDTAIPLELYCPEGEDTVEALVYPGCSALLKETLENSENLFAPAVLSALKKILDPYMDERGFVPSPDGIPCIAEFRMDCAEDVCRKLILPGTALTAEPADEEDEPVSAFHTEDGIKVAEAALNDFAEDDSVELHVECLPAYRKRGFASSCVAKLTQYYTENHCSVRYLCRVENRGSMRIAEKCGFTLQGKRISFVYYRRGSL